MSHARIEEVSDSDPSEGDISDIDFDERDILSAVQPRKSEAPAPAGPSSTTSRPQPQAGAPGFNPNLISPGDIPTRSVDRSKYKEFQCIYPVYFNARRSRAEGRRVSKEDAVENPMARDISTACSRLRLETLFEADKLHPKDWSNPGRVKIKLKGSGNSNVKNKHHLYKLISQHLKANPTTEASSIRDRIPGLPVPDSSKPFPHPAVPRGWKMDPIVPYYSAAMSGGGVSEDFFKQMMQEMQGQLPPGMGAAMGGMGGDMSRQGSGSGTEASKKKKDKKKGKA